MQLRAEMGLNLICVHVEHRTVLWEADPVSRRTQHASLMNKFLDAIWILGNLNGPRKRRKLTGYNITPLESSLGYIAIPYLKAVSSIFRVP